MNLFKLNTKSASETIKKVSEVFISNPKKYNRNILYYQFLEWKLKKYFDNLIVETLLTDDYIVEKLDSNEFGFKNNVIYKKDIIDEKKFYGEYNSSELKKVLTKEFETFLLEIIDESKIVTDIENHINITVDINDFNENNIRIYSVYIRYWRNYIYEQNKKLVKTRLIWLTFFLLILIGSIFTILNYFYG